MWAAAEHYSTEDRVRRNTGDEVLAHSEVIDRPLFWWFVPEGMDGPPFIGSGHSVLSQYHLLERLKLTDEVKERLERSGFNELVQAIVDEQPHVQRWQDIADDLEATLVWSVGAMHAVMMRRREDPSVGGAKRLT